MNIYVGNLSWNLTEQDLRDVFEVHGAVSSAAIILDRETNRSRGFGFVEMPNAQEAQEAINSLNGSDLKGRPIVVNEARPRSNDRRSGGGGSGGSRGGGSRFNSGNRRF